MSRGRRRHSEEASVSLFPFLAVLICTMGALIVLLVVTVQQAGNADYGSMEPIVSIIEPVVLEADPNPLQLEQPASELVELQHMREDLAWKADSLATSREATLARLQEQQLQLSMVEDQSRELQSQLERLRDEVETLKNASLNQLQETDGGAAQLAQLERELEKTSLELAAAQQQAAEGAGRFTIIPHKGANGTDRRPLYVECLPDQVVLQPEGIVLDTDDFDLPVGPGNALAASLRAQREYLLNAGAVASAAEPYPLLIVRPGAERAYAACRDALNGWDDDFGYELVPSHLELAYPPRDAKLAAVLDKTIRDVRTRRRLLTGKEPATGVMLGISSQGGGFVPANGRGPAGGPGSNDGYGPDAHHEPSDGFGSETGRALATDSSGGHLGDGDLGDGDLGYGQRSLSSSGNAAVPVSHGRDSEFPTMQDNASATGSVDTSNVDTSNVDTGSVDTGSVDTSNVDTSNVQVGRYETSTDATDSHGELGQASTSESQYSDGNQGGAQRTAAAGERQAAGGGAGQVSFSIAENRGPNWALPNDTVGAIGVVRPVHLTCTATELIVHAESQTGHQQIAIPFAITTTSAVQPCIAALWERMEAWGVAGNGMYWQPLLKCEVGANGEERFHELSALLHGSGLEIRRR